MSDRINNGELGTALSDVFGDCLSIHGKRLMIKIKEILNESDLRRSEREYKYWRVGKYIYKFESKVRVEWEGKADSITAGELQKLYDGLIEGLLIIIRND